VENGYFEMSDFSVALLKAELPAYLGESKMKALTLLRVESLDAKQRQRLVAFLGQELNSIEELTSSSKDVSADFLNSAYILARVHHPALIDPREQSLAAYLNVAPKQIRVESWMLASSQKEVDEIYDEALHLWREPAIESLWKGQLQDWIEQRSNLQIPIRSADDSFQAIEKPEDIGLEFSDDERKAIAEEEGAMGRSLNRCEWELMAQTWSEHCKHKIFAADIEAEESRLKKTNGIFKTYLREPAMKIAKEKKETYLSLFHDNSGVVGLTRPDGSQSDWSVCVKMETHNSPSAISPYGGASTGLVGVHRDILGTGLGAKPIASWDVLCFESEQHQEKRPSKALPPYVIRKGVLRGIEEGGNQSGIPTVQGSVVFHPGYAAKPLVYAGALGCLRREHVDKDPDVGDTLYCFGGAVGPDGLRGAVMSSRDLRQEDFSGSAVQVAQPFVQRCMTEFLIEARDLGLISCVTDNGAGGLASSCGEMATLTNGATIDLTNLRLKFDGLYAWEKLVSESQERMTVASRKTNELEALAQKWGVEFDRIGELNSSGQFKVLHGGQELVNLSLDFLHEKCPQMKLRSDWTWARELEVLTDNGNSDSSCKSLNSGELQKCFVAMLQNEDLCSREGVVRRFDHEVQGRSRKLPFAGQTQRTPQDGSCLEIFEDFTDSAFVALGHGLAPYRSDIHDNVLHSVDESVRQALLGGIKLEEAAFLDNYSWPDPLGNDRLTWKLLRSAEILGTVTKEWNIPFISGKDSMKNSSEGVDIPETLVVSAAGPAVAPKNVPASFFTRANDVIFMIPPLKSSLRDSTFERFLSRDSDGNYSSQNSFLTKKRFLLEGETLSQLDEDLSAVLKRLRERYQALEKLIAAGLIRSAKDIGEGGTLTSLFEMTLGRSLGVHVEWPQPKQELLFGEGLGGFLLTCDVHQISELTSSFADLKRVGVICRPHVLRFGEGEEWDLSKFEEAYVRKGQEGFWN
jgi:phosphoribosylformylglycinamidine synthase